jgi:hypothetical protein
MASAEPRETQDPQQEIFYISPPMNRYNRQQHTPRDLKIYQYNVHRSKDVVMAQFLRKEEVVSADIIAIQEP